MQPFIDFISQYTQVTEEEMNAFSKMAHYSSHKKNEVLQKQGEISRWVGFVVKGGVRSFYWDENDEEHTVNFSFENSPLIVIKSFFQQEPTPVSVVTLEPTELIYTGRTEFVAFLEAYPKYEGVIRKIMSQYMTVGNEHTRLLRINSARERYEEFCKIRPEVIQRVPLKHIASYLDVALETLSRVRAGKL